MLIETRLWVLDTLLQFDHGCLIRHGGMTFDEPLDGALAALAEAEQIERQDVEWYLRPPKVVTQGTLFEP